MRDRLRSVLKPHLAVKGAAGSVSDPTLMGSAQGGGRSGEASSGLLPGRGARLRSQVYGAAILLATTVLWASGGPTTKYLFLLPTPPSAALLTACISAVTALFLGVGLLGAAMEAGSGRNRRQAAAATVQNSDSAAAGAAAEAAAAGSSVLDADEAEAEALLHSGMHTTGAAGGALAAAAVAAREAAQEQDRQHAREREQAWSRAHEFSLPLLPSHGSHYYHSIGTATTATCVVADGLDAEAGTAASTAAAPPPQSATQRLLASALGSEAAGSGRDGGGGHGDPGGGGGGGRRSGGGGDGGLHVHRGPSLDGTTAGDPLPGLASPPPRLRSYTSAETRRSSGGGADGTAAPGPRRRSTGGGSGAAGDGGGGRWRLRLLTAAAPSLLVAGLELGCYNVTAAALGAWGMQRISATRSAFLAQATSLLTPLLVWLSGGRVGLVVWLACCCGALGGAMVALDNVYGTAAAAAAAATTGSGPTRKLLGLLTAGAVADLYGSAGNNAPAAAATPAGLFGTRVLLGGDAAVASAAAAAVGGGGSGGRWAVEGVLLSRQAMGAGYVLLSCVFWGLGTVRLGVHSARYPPLNLAAAAAVCYAGLSLLWLTMEVVGSPTAGLSDYLELGLLVRNHVTAALLLWAGLGPGALSSYLQVLGQQTVPPAQAQVLFSSTPLWSALIAQLLLPGEAMGPLAWAGGAVMLGASLLASLWQ